MLAPFTTAEQALDLATRIRTALAALPAERRAPTVSIGVTDAARSGTAVEAFVGAADRALYAAKNGGRNRAVLETAARPPMPGLRTL